MRNNNSCLCLTDEPQICIRITAFVLPAKFGDITEPQRQQREEKVGDGRVDRTSGCDASLISCLKKVYLSFSNQPRSSNINKVVFPQT